MTGEIDVALAKIDNIEKQLDKIDTELKEQGSRLTGGQIIHGFSIIGIIIALFAGGAGTALWIVLSDRAEKQAETTSETVAARVAETVAETVSTTRIVNRILGDEAFHSDVSERIGQLLAGAVLAFDRECPEGWEPYQKGFGKTLIGAGKEGKLEPREKGSSTGEAVTLADYELGDQGGSESFLLSEAQLPSHGHRLAPVEERSVQKFSITGTEDIITDTGSPTGDIVANFGTDDGSQGVARTPEGVANMPPYIALNFCIKS